MCLEKFNYARVNVKSNTTDFLPCDAIMFFTEEKEINLFDTFKKIITSHHLKFLNLHSGFSKEELGLLNYLSPNYTHKGLTPTIIFNALGIKTTISRGIFVIEQGSYYVIDLENKNYEYIALVVENLISEIVKSRSNFSNSRKKLKNYLISIPDDLDNEVKERLEVINEQLEWLRESGKLLLALPYFNNIIEDKFSDVEVSNIIVDNEFNIILEKYPNLEIKMSHLTKVVYILFVRKGKINIDDLHQHKEEIIGIYKEVTNQNDYNKITKSVEDLIDNNSKAIYTHISRVKSIFYNLMDSRLADKYIIKGENFGDKVKFIPVIKERNIRERKRAIDKVLENLPLEARTHLELQIANGHINLDD